MTFEPPDAPELYWLDSLQDDEHRYYLGRFVAERLLVVSVLGGVMVGWGIVFVLFLRGPFAAGAGIGWRMIAVSVVAWFIQDTAYSLWSGFWQKAVLNTLFAIPLAATHRSHREEDA